MNIESAKYLSQVVDFDKDTKENSMIEVVIDGETMFVPINAVGNRHWIAIQEWVAEGNTIAEAD